MTITVAPRKAASRAALAPAAALGLAQSTVLAHLSCLGDCGLVDFRPRGRASVYFLTQPELLNLLAKAETLLPATGDAVAPCAGLGGTRPELRPTTTADTTPDEKSPR